MARKSLIERIGDYFFGEQAFPAAVAFEVTPPPAQPEYVRPPAQTVVVSSDPEQPPRRAEVTASDVRAYVKAALSDGVKPRALIEAVHEAFVQSLSPDADRAVEAAARGYAAMLDAVLKGGPAS